MKTENHPCDQGIWKSLGPSPRHRGKGLTGQVQESVGAEEVGAPSHSKILAVQGSKRKGRAVAGGWVSTGLKDGLFLVVFLCWETSQHMYRFSL